MEISTSRARVVAVLGPTNTGKTYLAMDRMLGHATGMIGFPLRLLARENYDRAVRVKGRNAVALITGEEKILPLGANYFICTVESMPIDRQVDFLAIDEIQMCADPDRGHVFTDRLLHARGVHETMFLGAETLRPLIRQLVPEAEFTSRPRFSTLSYIGNKKTTRLPKRSAIVAFSAADVYAIAELVRRQRGGAAVVMGALSPRTRNAQVEMYQSGEVDYIVATDAIGMGLNMDVDHVAFADTCKFDGRIRRQLEATELAQIAGRAGRYMNDGTFGVTGDAPPVSEEMVARIENHEFEAIRKICWRNPKPNFTSAEDLIKSLSVPPNLQGLVRAREADDELILRQLAKDPDIAELAEGYDAIRTLWDVCQVPDFGNVMSHGHAALVGRLYTQLMTRPHQLSDDWLEKQVGRLDRTDGDIEHLTGRISGVRTWTYVAFRSDWIADAAHWRERTRAIEDRLSDALHECLTLRFVDRRTAQLMQRLKETPDLLAAVKADGDVVVEGHFVGILDGFRFTPDAQPHNADEAVAMKAIEQAASKVLHRELADRVGRLENAADDAFDLERDGGNLTYGLLWQGELVGRLNKGAKLMKPGVTALVDELVSAPLKQRIERRLGQWIQSRITDGLASLSKLEKAELSGMARGLAFQLAENLGTLPRHRAKNEIEALEKKERRDLRSAGVRIGRESIYLESLLKPQAVEVRGLLWALFNGLPGPVSLPAPGRVSVASDTEPAKGFFDAIGYRVFSKLAIRIDMVERIAEKAWELSRKGAFIAHPDLLSLAGCGVDELAVILKRLGYRQKTIDGEIRYRFAYGRRVAAKPETKDAPENVKAKPKKRHKPPKQKAKRPEVKPEIKVDPDSPFARLKEFQFTR